MPFKKNSTMFRVLLSWACIFGCIFVLTFSNSSASSIFPYPSACLVNDSGTIYFISGGTKVPFTNWQAFVGLGYSLSNVVTGNLADYTLSSYTISTANAAHPWGSWLIYRETVYYSTQAGMIGVPSSDILTSNGGNWSYVVKANSYDVAALNANPNLPLLTNNDSRIYSAPNYQFGTNPLNNSNPVSATGISVISPAGGAQWAIGSSQIITWTAPASVSYVNIGVTPYNSSSFCSGCAYPQYSIAATPIATNVPNNGSYFWTIGSTVQGASLLSSGQYALTISSAMGSITSGNSALFSITGNAGARVGQLVKDTNGTIFLVGNGGLVSFPSPDVFNSWGFCPQNALPENSAETGYGIIGLMPSKGTSPLPNYVPSNLPSNSCGNIFSINSIPTLYPTTSSIGSGYTVNFYWNIPSLTNNSALDFYINCVSGVSLWDVANNLPFACGDVGRYTPASGSVTVKFTNTLSATAQLTASLNYGASQPLSSPVTVSAVPTTSISITTDPATLTQPIAGHAYSAKINYTYSGNLSVHAAWSGVPAGLAITGNGTAVGTTGLNNIGAGGFLTLSGTPIQPGTYTLTLNMGDSGIASDSRVFSITVSPNY